MSKKHVSIALAAMLAAGVLWFRRSTWRTDQAASNESSTILSIQRAGRSDSGQVLPQRNASPAENNNLPPKHEPPRPNQRFMDFTPEQRVEFARRGHGPGG